ncbi:MAG: 50S ribosomal protein L3 [bacterium]|nr:50S ribosomal protein L3 [bacterium]
MATPHGPRRGSLQYKPRKRAAREVPRIRAWPEEEQVRVQGFAGYKAFMTHVFVVDENKNSPTYGQEIFLPATVLEVPPMRIFGIRVYGIDEETQYLGVIGEVWNLANIDQRLHFRITLPRNFSEQQLKERLEKIESLLDKVKEVRVLAYTNVRLAGFPKKTPDVMEWNIGGKDIEKKWQYAKEILGKDIRISEIFKEKEYVDVFAVTKGKGFEGPVKRWGKKIMKRKHKLQGIARHIGSAGPRGPARVMWTVPYPGQLGYHTRCEYNKIILKIGDNPEEINPPGGIPHYGIVRTDWVLLAGSVPGPRKRLVRLRPAIRPPKGEKLASWVGQITYISRESLLAK